MASCTPWLGSFSLTSKNTAYNLQTLVMTAPSTHRPLYGMVAQFLTIQLDPVQAGNAVLYIGNSDVSSSECGVAIFAGQSWPIFSMDANLIILNNIYLLSDTDGVQVNVGFLTR